MNTNTPPENLTVEEAANYLRLAPCTLNKFRVTSGGPAFCKAGGRVIYRRTDLDEWLGERTFRSTSAAGSRRKRAVA
jgi:hypothetical protein